MKKLAQFLFQSVYLPHTTVGHLDILATSSSYLAVTCSVPRCCRKLRRMAKRAEFMLQSLQPRAGRASNLDLTPPSPSYLAITRSVPGWRMELRRMEKRAQSMLQLLQPRAVRTWKSGHHCYGFVSGSHSFRAWVAHGITQNGEACTEHASATTASCCSHLEIWTSLLRVCIWQSLVQCLGVASSGKCFRTQCKEVAGS